MVGQHSECDASRTVVGSVRTVGVLSYGLLPLELLTKIAILVRRVPWDISV